MRIATFDGFDAASMAALRARQRRLSPSFGDFTSDAGSVVSDQVSKMIEIDSALWAAMPSSPSDRERYIVESWHTSANKWWDPATTEWAVSSAANLASWKTMGANLIAGAARVANELRSYTLSTQIAAFAKSFPAAITTVLTKTGQTIGTVAGSTVAAAAPGVGKTLLWLGIPLAIVILLATSGGRKIDLGIVKLG